MTEQFIGFQKFTKFSGFISLKKLMRNEFKGKFNNWINMNSIPEFITERLILKSISIKDIESYKKHFVDYEVIRHLSHVVPWPYPEDGVFDFITNRILPSQGKDRWFWAIYLQENPNELIGVVDLWRKGHPENRGFWLGRKFWGNGYMTEAVIPVMDYAFDKLGFEKLVFSNAIENIASGRIKEKTGARRIATEDFKFVDPNLTKHEIWELTNIEWKMFKENHLKK